MKKKPNKQTKKTNKPWLHIQILLTGYVGHILCGTHLATRGVTGKFFWGTKSFFLIFFLIVKCFFPVEKFHFGTPKQILVVLKSEKQKKKKKKRVLSSFCNFPTFNFQPSLYNFPSFLLSFCPFFPCRFFPVGLQKFPCQKSLGYSAPCLLCHCWLLQVGVTLRVLCNYCMQGSSCHNSCRVLSEYPGRYSTLHKLH